MKNIVVIGNGMTGFKFCEKFINYNLSDKYKLYIIGEEPRPAYDRVHLTDYYTGTSAEDLLMQPASWYNQNGIQLITNQLVTNVNRIEKQVETNKGEQFSYDILIFATGSSAFVPQLPGLEKKGVFVYRTIEDLEEIKRYISTSKKAAVIGGGLLGLEAAKALMDDGLETTVIERGPFVLGRQVDEKGGALLGSSLEKMKLKIKLKAFTKSIIGNGSIEALEFEDGEQLKTDILVISAGISPRDEIANKIGLEVGERGGIVVDKKLKTNDPNIYAIGECALAMGMIWGLVAPCFDMAEAVVKQLSGEDGEFTGADLSTKLKLIGTQVASFGDAQGRDQNSIPLIYENKITGIYKRLNVTEDGQYLLGGILVGDTEDYNMLLQMYRSKLKLPKDPGSLLMGSSSQGGAQLSVLDLPDDAAICSCENVSKGNICNAIDENDITGVAEIKKCTKAGTGCGGCVPMLDDLLTAMLKKQGKVVKKVLCEHFDFTRQELYDLTKVEGLKTYNEVLHKHGTGHGCEICKPAIASILASCWNDLITKQPEIQDTNDKFLANIQRGGTYSVVPRVAGGEITPDKLVVLGNVAKKYDLYCKITGGQRIDLFGAAVNDLPKIWKELIDAGFESGHAYGKSLRTVKSCVGSSWCRYGQQDSVGFAIKIENRYKGLRSPHKLKGGVSGCIRECAEAHGKDFGIIATEKGWNLYVCGNGGAKPVHAQLLAANIDTVTCISYLDRFLMYYIQTAGPLTRTSKWLEGLDGGMDYLKEVVIDDSLGIGQQLEVDMSKLIAAYACEWKEVVNSPELKKKFKHFANSDEKDPNIQFVPMRNQKMPVAWEK